jgi:hypothetical protein
MDIRDIILSESDLAIECKNDFYREIEVLQKSLIDHYIIIEGFPNYPLEINTKSNQVLLKDFISRIVEELGEAYESLDKGLHTHHSDKSQLYWNFFEELADALHFFTETLIYSGVTPYRIGQIMKLWGEDISKFYPNNGELQVWPALVSTIHNPSISRPHINFANPEVISHGNCLTLFNPHTVVDFAPKALWSITYSLQLARNTLKNKPWKQTQVVTDITAFSLHLVEAYAKLIAFIFNFGVSPENLYWLYLRKNRINEFRIKSKY